MVSEISGVTYVENVGGDRRPAPPIWIRRAVLLALLFAGWQAYAIWSASAASPVETAAAFWTGWTDGSLAAATLQTLSVLLVGIGAGVLLATALTFLATLTRFGEDLLELMTSILGPLPAVVALPFALVWFASGTDAVVFATALATISPLAINLRTGFKTTSPTMLAVGRNIGLSRIRLITDVRAPAALPYVVAGLKTASVRGWYTVVAAEVVVSLVGGEGGLGVAVVDVQRDVVTPEMLAALLTVAALGVLLDGVFAVLERRTTVRWGMRSP